MNKTDSKADVDAQVPRPQFSLRSLLIVVTLVCIVMGLLVVPIQRAQQRSDAIKAIRELGWVVTTHPTPSGPIWGRMLFGDVIFFDAAAVESPIAASDDAMVHLAHMPKLERAFIAGEKVTDTGARRLAGLRKLKTVCLTGTNVTDNVARYFDGLENLERLYLTHTQVTEQGAQRLKGALPACKVSRLEEMTNSIGMRFVLIPPGEFMMGSPAAEKESDDERPQHRCRITKPFYLGVHEVTQGQYERVMGSCPWSKQVHGKGADYPATEVDWEDAMAFCEKLSAEEGCTYRLPTEAEWEYACRAGSTARYFFGDDLSVLGNYAWYDENARKAGERYAHAVGQKKPNGWGLYDMHGNVSEWCADWYDEEYYSKSPIDDPPGPSSGEYRVLRSGKWHHLPRFARSARRGWNKPDWRTGHYGFRIVRTP